MILILRGGVCILVVRMNYREIIYSKICELLASVIEQLETNLDEEENDELNEVLENLVGLEDVTLEVYVGGTESSCIHVVKNQIGDLSLDENFPNWKKLKDYVLLAHCIEGDGSVLLDDELSVNPDDFLVEEYSGKELPFGLFAHVNETECKQSIGYFSFPKLSEDELDGSGYNSQFLAVLFYLLNWSSDLTKPVIIYRKDAGKKSSEAALRLLATFDGKVIHPEVSGELPGLPMVYRNRVSAINKYNQFDEILIILSEINSSKGLLKKFLSLYHVIESFMFKVPIVNLGDNNDSNIFSIRDFRRLYDATKERESDAMAKLFTSDEMGGFWNRQLDGVAFHRIVLTSLADLSSDGDFKSDDVNVLIKHIRVKGVETFSDLSGQLNGKKYSEIFYAIRNAIVHNKETEFHISHHNLIYSLAIFIEKIFLQPIRLLVSDLLCDSGSKIWYQGPNLHLYEA